MLSIVIGSRNDNYIGNSNWRLQTTINFLAKELDNLNKLDQIELIIVDWGSPIPLHSVLTLSEQAKKIVRFIILPISWIDKIGYKDFASTIAYNIGIRRAAGYFIGISTADILFTEKLLRKLFNIFMDSSKREKNTERSLFSFGRKDIPTEIVKQNLDLSDLDKYIQENGRKLSLISLHPYFLSPAALLMMHRNLWYETRSFDERIIHWGSSDVDLCLRVRLKYHVVDMSKEEDAYLYHLSHNYPGFIRHKTSQPLINPFVVNDEDWGFVNYQFEEFPCRTPLKQQTCLGNIVVRKDKHFKIRHLLNLIKFAFLNPGQIKYIWHVMKIFFIAESQNKRTLRELYYFLKKLKHNIRKISVIQRMS